MNIHEDEFEDQGPEPNMKLSHAFLVVLLLHVIAVGGLYAFNRMKADKGNVAAKSAPSSQGGEVPSGNGSQGKKGSEDPENRAKAPVAAKTSEPVKVARDTETGTKISGEPKGGSKGLLSGVRGLLKKTTVGAATAAVVEKATAQGNVSPATDRQDVAPETAGGTYTVHAGDTITKITSSLGVAIPELEKANNMTGNSTLQVGQVLKVPAKTTQAPEPSATPREATAAATDSVPATGGMANVPIAPRAAGGSEYTVVKGDNPYKIAKKFKITPEELMKANGITDPKKIQIGQKLAIPAPLKKGSK